MYLANSSSACYLANGYYYCKEAKKKKREKEGRVTGRTRERKKEKEKERERGRYYTILYIAKRGYTRKRNQPSFINELSR